MDITIPPVIQLLTAINLSFLMKIEPNKFVVPKHPRYYIAL